MRSDVVRSVVLVLVCSSFSLAWSSRADDPAPTAPPAGKLTDVQRGQYLVTFGGCNDCHSPKTMTPEGPRIDPDGILSGYPANKPLPKVPDGVIGPVGWGAIASPDLTAWVGPWGVSFAANLTPDKETGLGSWTVKDFMNAMRTGRHKGEGRMILPPMPWYTMAPMSEEDLKAIFAYLQSLKPVQNKVPDPIPPAAASAP